MAEALCPCGSKQPEAKCCAPLHKGGVAKTAEQLMRSRYSAYVRGEIDYIIATHDPDTRGDVDREATAQWSKETTWKGLQILATDKGGEADDTGIVEFVATGEARGHEIRHHERSRFRKVDGRWYFVDGETPKKAPVVKGAELGRNEPCHCGSGKKFKRCHGA